MGTRVGTLKLYQELHFDWTRVSRQFNFEQRKQLPWEYLEFKKNNFERHSKSLFLFLDKSTRIFLGK